MHHTATETFTHLLILISTVAVTCSSFHQKKPTSGSVSFTSDSLYIDPSDLPESTLAPATVAAERDSLRRAFEKCLPGKTVTSGNFTAFAPVLFTYRDPAVIPLFREIIQDTAVHIFFRMLSVYCLGECGSDDEFTFLSRYYTTENPLFREYIASALNKLATTREHFSCLRNLVKKERNPFVYKTLLARKLPPVTTTPVALPLFESDTIRKELFYPNVFKVDFRAIGYRATLSTPPAEPPVTGSCIYPHQQYKVNRRLYTLIDYPVVSFGFENGEWGIHVGEDSGWLFPGMPIHAIMDGIVVRMQHESTWGCLTVIESRLPDKRHVTVFYGHLSHRNNVTVGDTVQTGDKIGEIGPSYTLTNGGYLAHLHLGIEKTGFNNALIKGWYHNTDRWYSPMAFIAAFNTAPPKNSPAEWILYKSRR
ncbi:MAG: peptidoglycan DD-metalloendopeptidase family protein [Chitinispirillaceae bacterium]|nr:peptidoglycan DD-metalloendopeptidase family protein [Chitinispirillaceae bacterium]